jgi:hypothetical protein
MKSPAMALDFKGFEAKSRLVSKTGDCPITRQVTLSLYVKHEFSQGIDFTLLEFHSKVMPSNHGLTSACDASLQ